MAALQAEAIERFDVDAAELMASSPPRWVHPMKRAVAALSCPAGAVHSGRVRYSRWRAAECDAICLRPDLLPKLEVIVGVMDYRVEHDGAFEAGPVHHWQMNFADADLFYAYGSSLLAQDEWQVMEHPVLGALREYLGRTGRSTRIASGRQDACVCTPVLVEGVERRCCFAASVTSGDRVVPLYGWRFAAAAQADVLAAVEVFGTPRRSNVVAIAAPAYGVGPYTLEQVWAVLSGCAAGFRACEQEAAAIGARAVINTGFWGCGAFGGNRVVMVALQILAACAAGVGALRLFSMDAGGLPAVAAAQSLVHEVMDPRRDEVSAAEVAERIVARRLAWGESDGN
jgi:hypothetical protein